MISVWTRFWPLVYSVIGIVVFLLAYAILEKLTPLIRKEIEEDQNTALGIGSCFIALAIIISAAISDGPAGAISVLAEGPCPAVVCPCSYEVSGRACQRGLPTKHRHLPDREQNQTPGDVVEPAGAPAAMLLVTLVIAVCGLVYELLAGTISSYLLGDSSISFPSLLACLWPRWALAHTSPASSILARLLTISWLFSWP